MKTQGFQLEDTIKKHYGDVIANVMGSFAINQTLWHGSTRT